MLANITIPKSQEIKSYIFKKHGKEITSCLLGKLRQQSKEISRYRYIKQYPIRAFIKFMLGREI
jgi:hypothetical protein